MDSVHGMLVKKLDLVSLLLLVGSSPKFLNTPTLVFLVLVFFCLPKMIDNV